MVRSRGRGARGRTGCCVQFVEDVGPVLRGDSLRVGLVEFDVGAGRGESESAFQDEEVAVPLVVELGVKVDVVVGDRDGVDEVEEEE